MILIKYSLSYAIHAQKTVPFLIDTYNDIIILYNHVHFTSIFEKALPHWKATKQQK